VGIVDAKAWAVTSITEEVSPCPSPSLGRWGLVSASAGDDLYSFFFHGSRFV
jgi:hypothetical protein